VWPSLDAELVHHQPVVGTGVAKSDQAVHGSPGELPSVAGILHRYALTPQAVEGGLLVCTSDGGQRTALRRAFLTGRHRGWLG